MIIPVSNNINHRSHGLCDKVDLLALADVTKFSNFRLNDHTSVK